MRDLFKDDDGGSNGIQAQMNDGTGRGREVKEAPLCAVCVVEAEIDGASEETIVKRGLRRVEKMDNGLTRKRREENEGRYPQYRKETALVRPRAKGFFGHESYADSRIP